MIIPRRQFLCLVASAGALTGATAARAETYPARPVRIIVATTAGGATDIVARLIAQWLTAKLGQSFVVENRSGGNNNVGSEFAAHSPADGYTLFMANSVNSINTVLYKNLNYNFVSDFTPVIHVVRSPLFMLVHPAVPAKTVPEFNAYAKANPGKLAMASGGSGSTGHLAGELFMMRTGVRMIHVPYRGESAALTDVLAGQPQVLFSTTGSAMSFVKAGTVRALAVTSSERLAGLPDIPPLAEFVSGYEVNGWSGLCVPKGTPGGIVTLLNKEINAALADPTIRARIADMGGVAPGGSPADFGKYIADEIGRWQKVVAFAHIQVN
ncbi:MAG: tripartite tricarboxylate transporter substrate binding protein [Xanthobacteraceae bacterium]